MVLRLRTSEAERARLARDLAATMEGDAQASARRAKEVHTIIMIIMIMIMMIILFDPYRHMAYVCVL
jgi:hypothetical protein